MARATRRSHRRRDGSQSESDYFEYVEQDYDGLSCLTLVGVYGAPNKPVESY